MSNRQLEELSSISGIDINILKSLDEDTLWSMWDSYTNDYDYMDNYRVYDSPYGEY